MNIKKEPKYKVIKTEVPIDDTKPNIKKEKKEIIDLTEIKNFSKILSLLCYQKINLKRN